MLRDFETNVLETFPSPCKAYPAGLATVQLPRGWSVGGGSATAVLAGRRVAAGATLDLTRLARILHLSAGVARVAERRDGRRYLFRASGSAGGLFPLELYIAARGIEGLADGVYWFDPIRHALVSVGPAPVGDVSALVVSGIPSRTGWRYAERGFRHLYWDAGAMLANTLALAQDAGLTPLLFTVFPDAAVTRLIGADGVHELPLAIITLGEGEPAIQPGGAAAHGEGEPAIQPGGAAVHGAVDRRAPREFPLITDAQHAGDSERLGAPHPAGAALPGEPPTSAALDTVIRQRISTRIMDRSRSVDRGLLQWSLAASLRGCQVPHFVAVHAVEDFEPGLYRWPSLENPIRRGDLREELFEVCFDQELARDACFVVIGAVDLDQLEDRDYRDVQLQAGLVDGRLHLAAFALGIGASGMTFLDSRIPTLLGEALAGLLFTCVGVPSYRHRPAGAPGHPVKMAPLRPPTP